MDHVPGDDPNNSDGPRILLADDSDAERRAMALLLCDAGYRVDEADGGQAALELLQRDNFDLLVLDLQMPRTDGFAVLSYVQRNRPGMPVVLTSGMPPDDIQVSMHRLPKSELPPLLIKPIGAEQLLGLIEIELNRVLPPNTP